MNPLLTVPPLLVAVILHEVAHGYAAEKLGDPTARRLGRITLNPIKHIDLWMTILLPGLLILANAPIIFGGAKPVPVDPRNFSNPRIGMMWVALAGPVTNFILAGCCYALLVGAAQLGIGDAPTDALSLLLGWLVYGIVINLILALFNLVPIPPLDGGRIAVGLLPVPLARALARLEPFGILIVMVLLMSGVLNRVLSPLLRVILGALPLS